MLCFTLRPPGFVGRFGIVENELIEVSPFVWLLFTSLVAELLTGSFGILQMVKRCAQNADAQNMFLCVHFKCVLLFFVRFC